jgi:hypothetical protein
MNRDELTAALAALEAHLEDRVEIWRVVVEPNGTFGGRAVGRIYRGSFQRPRTKDPRTNEPPPSLEDQLTYEKKEGTS